jgi:hypothetical protein
MPWVFWLLICVSALIISLLTYPLWIDRILIKLLQKFQLFVEVVAYNKFRNISFILPTKQNPVVNKIYVHISSLSVVRSGIKYGGLTLDSQSRSRTCGCECR